MKTIAKIAVLFLSSAAFSNIMAGEPPAVVGVKDKVRMSTLIIVGKVESIAIVNAKSRKVVRNNSALAKREYELESDEKACFEIKIERVLYSSHSPTYAPAKAPTTVEVTFGSRGMGVVSYPDQNIFYLTRHLDRTNDPGFYPFFDWTNLCDAISKEDEVVRLIAAFDAVK